MSQHFEVINLDEHDLNVTVGPGMAMVSSDSEPETDIGVKPPLSDEEHIALMDAVGPDSDLGQELVASTETGGYTEFHVTGEPSARHLELGIELAKQVALLRDARAAKVTAAIGEHVQSHLVLNYV